MNVVQSRNLFVDSSTTQRGESRNMNLSVPQGMMTCGDHQSLRVTLASFQMRKNFYNVNQHNNTFYVYASTAGVITSGVCTVEPGDYTFFEASANFVAGSFSNALEAAIIRGLKLAGAPAPTCTATYTSFTGQWNVTIAAVPAAWTAMKLVAFKIPNYTATPANIITQAVSNLLGSEFQSSADLLGGCPTKINSVTGTDLEQFDLLTDLWTPTTALAAQTQTFLGQFKAALSTDDSVYVRTNLQNTGFQTAGFDTGGNLYPQIASTQILGKISLANIPRRTSWRTLTAAGAFESQTYESFDTAIIDYQDRGDLVYSLRLTNRNITEFTLRITDRLGRLIPAISNEQISCNNMSWTATLRIDVLE